MNQHSSSTHLSATISSPPPCGVITHCPPDSDLHEARERDAGGTWRFWNSGPERRFWRARLWRMGSLGTWAPLSAWTLSAHWTLSARAAMFGAWVFSARLLWYLGTYTLLVAIWRISRRRADKCAPKSGRCHAEARPAAEPARGRGRGGAAGDPPLQSPRNLALTRTRSWARSSLRLELLWSRTPVGARVKPGERALRRRSVFMAELSLRSQRRFHLAVRSERMVTPRLARSQAERPGQQPAVLGVPRRADTTVASPASAAAPAPRRVVVARLRRLNGAALAAQVSDPVDPLEPGGEQVVTEFGRGGSTGDGRPTIVVGGTVFSDDRVPLHADRQAATSRPGRCAAPGPADAE